MSKVCQSHMTMSKSMHLCTPLLSGNAVISQWVEIETIVRDAMFNNPDNNPDAVQIKN